MHNSFVMKSCKIQIIETGLFLGLLNPGVISTDFNPAK